MHEGEENCRKYLKREWNRKEGWGNKDFKKEGAEMGRRGKLLSWFGAGEGGCVRLGELSKIS